MSAALPGRAARLRPDITGPKLLPLIVFFVLALAFPFLPFGDRREFLLQIGYVSAPLRVCAVYTPGTVVFQVSKSAGLPAPVVGRKPSTMMLRASGTEVPW